MKGTKSCIVDGTAVKQSRKIINKFNLNIDNNEASEFYHNLPYSSCGDQYGDGIIEKCKHVVTSLYPAAVKGNAADKNTPVGVRRTIITEDEKGRGKLIENSTSGEIDRETTITCHCGNHLRITEDDGRNCQLGGAQKKWKKYNFEEGIGNPIYALESRVESERHGNLHKFVVFPYKTCFVVGERKKIGDECCTEKEELRDDALDGLLNIHKVEESGLDYPYGPYVLIPKHVYCLGRQSRNRKFEESDPYFKTPPVDVSVETSLTNLGNQLSDEELINQLRRRNLDFSEMDGPKTEITENQSKEVAEIKLQQEASEPSDGAADKGLENKTFLLPTDGIQANEVPLEKGDKTKAKKFIQEIKYYEGALNIFGEDRKEAPFLKVTKTVTFETERPGKQGEKVLGIDSWTQTDGDRNDRMKESNVSCGSNKNHNKEPPSTVPSLSNSLVETAKVCGECLKLLAGKYGGEGNIQGKLENLEPGKVQNATMNKSTSVDKGGQNVVGMNLIKDDFVRFIAELFLEAIPKDIYNRIMGDSERFNNEEYEVRVKSYDKGSTESCNLKTCKMKNMDLKSDNKPVKDVARPNCERARGTWANECTCSDFMCGARSGRATKSAPNAEVRRPNRPSKASLETPKKEDENTYDCQISLNGRKILVKVNKSVEDLLLSGKIHNVFRISPNENSNDCSKQSIPLAPEGKTKEKTKVAGNCRCGEDAANFGKKDSVSGKGGVSKEKVHGTQKNSAKGGIRRGDSFTAIETGNYQKKAGHDLKQLGRNTKPMVTSPPFHGSDGRRTDKSHNQDKNVMFDNTKSLFWSNVEVYNKENGASDSVLKAKKLKGSDYDSNRMRRRVENPYKLFTNRRTNCIQEKPKRHHLSGVGKPVNECFPLYWESQYLKYCDQMVSEDRGCREKTENYKANLRDGRACNFVHEIEKRMMVTPTFGQCNAIDTPQPLCIIKIADSENCENPQYRDYTIANVTSVKLNSNPFEGDTITCRKCIETLRSCANWEDDKGCSSYRDADTCSYYWNGITGKRSGESVCSNAVKISNRSTAKSDTTLRSKEGNSVLPPPGTAADRFSQKRNYCGLNEQLYPKEEQVPWKADENQFLQIDPTLSKVPSRKLNGICFSVSRIPHQDTSNVDPAIKTIYGYHQTECKGKHVGVSTSDINLRNKRERQPGKNASLMEMCDREEREMTVDIEKSSVFISVQRRASKSTMTKENWEEWSTTTVVTHGSQGEEKVSSDDNKSNVNIEVLVSDEDTPPSDEVIQLENGENIGERVARKRFSWKKSWRWWWWRWKKSDNLQRAAKNA